MTDPDNQLLKQMEEHEAGVSDLIDAYELAEQQYFAAVHASAPYIEQTISSDTTSRAANANLG